MKDDFKSQFSEEIVQSVFNQDKRSNLCITKEDSIFTGAASTTAMMGGIGAGLSQAARKVSFDSSPDQNNQVMKLKKTTILTGNHPKARDRAQTDNDLSKGLNLGARDGRDKVYVEKGKLKVPEMAGEDTQGKHRKLSHAF